MAADRTLPIGILVTAMLLLSGSITGLTVVGMLAFQVIVTGNPADTTANAVGVWLFLLLLDAGFAFALWTAVGLFALDRHARRNVLQLAQSLISVGLTAGAVCLYLAVEKQEDNMKPAAIFLLSLASIGSTWKIYFRLPNVIRLFP